MELARNFLLVASMLMAWLTKESLWIKVKA
jgi:hypothetical protein